MQSRLPLKWRSFALADVVVHRRSSIAPCMLPALHKFGVACLPPSLKEVSPSPIRGDNRLLPLEAQWRVLDLQTLYVASFKFVVESMSTRRNCR